VPDTHPLSVLVVEDYEDAADSLATLLRLHGYRVTVARTGGAALELAADDPPDVALLDIGLPDIDGWELARRMCEQAAGRRTGGCTSTWSSRPPSSAFSSGSVGPWSRRRRKK
jgi:CheY-like chemotaxis protein